MKKLVQKIMAGLAILLVSMGLVSSQLASAAEHSDVVTAVTITDTAGIPSQKWGNSKPSVSMLTLHCQMDKSRQEILQ